jgi:ankyrin repeat protein
MEDVLVLNNLVHLLPRDSVNVLLQASKTLNSLVRKLEKENLYWLRTIEHQFNLTIPTDKYFGVEWMHVYGFLVQHSGNLLLSNRISLVQLGLDNGQDPSANNNTPVNIALSEGHINICLLLLKDHRVNPTDNKGETICLATILGYTDIVKLLLKDPRVNPNVCDLYATRLAHIRGHTNVVKLLLNDSRVISLNDNYYKSNMDFNREQLRKFKGEIQNGIFSRLYIKGKLDISDDEIFAVAHATAQRHSEVVSSIIFSNMKQYTRKPSVTVSKYTLVTVCLATVALL